MVYLIRAQNLRHHSLQNLWTEALNVQNLNVKESPSTSGYAKTAPHVNVQHCTWNAVSQQRFDAVLFVEPRSMFFSKCVATWEVEQIWNILYVEFWFIQGVPEKINDIYKSNYAASTRNIHKTRLSKNIGAIINHHRNINFCKQYMSAYSKPATRLDVAPRNHQGSKPEIRAVPRSALP